MEAYIVLACEGHTDKDSGFCLCRGVENYIVDLEKISKTEQYLDLIKYLDQVPKLFEGPCCKINIITNAVYKIYEMGYLDERTYQCIAYFYQRHQHCGRVLYIQPKSIINDGQVKGE